MRQQITELETSETQQKQVEENLFQRTSEFEAIFQAFPDLYFRLDSNGTILDYIAGHTSYFYVSPEVFLGKRMQDVLPSNVGQQFHEAILQVLQTDSLVSIEYSLAMPNGEQSYEARLLPFLKKQIIVVVRDITERKKAEEVLRESEKRYRTLFEESRDAIYITTREGRFVDVNQSALELFGFTKEEMMGMNAQEIYVLASDRYRFQQEIEQKGTVREYEVKFRKKDGTEMNCLLTATLRLADDGSIVGYQGILRDVTERKKGEEEIKILNEDLKARATELEAINKELEAFSYSVSHDLRTPLLMIEGFSRVLIEKYSNYLNTKGQYFLNVIRTNTQKMGKLIEDLLAFSRLGRQEIKSSDIDMGELAKAVIEELRLIDPGRPLLLNIKPLPPARGDQAMIRQVFVNLLSNATKFTRPKGTAMIEIGGRVEENENLYYVKDNGVGFDMKYVNKLFNVFQRFHSIEEFEGIGIGLAIVQRIIHRHGGQVWAEGKVNEGATFYFTLPKET